MNKNQEPFDFEREKNKFLAAHKEFAPSANGVAIEIIEHPKGFLSVALRVTRLTTHTEIKKAVTFLLDWRNRLNAWQLPYRFELDLEIYLQVKAMVNSGSKYKEIAETYNEKLSGYLEMYYSYIDYVEQNVPKNINNLDQLYSWLYNPKNSNTNRDAILNSQGLNLAEALLEVFGFDNSDIRAHISGALKAIRQGSKPFPPNLPITDKRTYRFVRKKDKTLRAKQLRELRKNLEIKDEIKSHTETGEIDPYLRYRGTVSESYNDIAWSTADLWDPYKHETK